MAEGASYCDPYDFENDDYVPSQTERFSDSFIELFREDSDEEVDFPGFTNSEAFKYGSRKINEFHTAAAKEKENVDPARQTRPKKRKADPSR